MTKRKSPHEAVETTRRKRRALGVAKDRATKARSEHNEKNSWFGKLPREVRRQIWTSVLGGRVLHIIRLHYFDNIDDVKKPWDLVTCVNERTPLQLYELSKKDPEFLPELENGSYWKSLNETKKFNVSGVRDRRSSAMTSVPLCLEERPIGNPPVYRDPASPYCLNLELLRTYRMVYHEANNMLWTTNTFSFHESKSFSDFFNNRTTLQPQLLRKLHFTFGLCESWFPLWSKALSTPVIKKLKGLRETHSYVEEEFCYHHDYWVSVGINTRSESSLDAPRLFERDSIDFLGNFRILPLRVATVIIDYSTKYGVESDNVSHSKCLQWAEEIRSQLPTRTTRQGQSEGPKRRHSKGVKRRKVGINAYIGHGVLFLTIRVASDV